MTIRAGVIGTGYLGRHHARIYSGLQGISLEGVCDADGARAEEIAAQYGCRPYSKPEDLVGRCDVLSIATPTTTHYEVAVKCLGAGKHILLEKPITSTAAEARELVSLARSRGLILQVGHLEQYNPGLSEAKKRLGEPIYFESERLSPFQGRGIDVDITLDLMIHDIEIIQGLADSGIREIKASGARLIAQTIDEALAWIEFENGSRAVLKASRVAPEKRRTLRIVQKDSILAVDFQNQELRRYVPGEAGMTPEIISPEKTEPLLEEIRDFVDCVRGGGSPRVSGERGAAALETALRISDMIRKSRDAG